MLYREWLNQVYNINYVHCTIQEVLNGNIDTWMLEESLKYLEEIREEI
tara:strand:- start:85 stop:228 length:144 start_codon:yes stop_codon:yes gene_type:complete